MKLRDVGGVWWGGLSDLHSHFTEKLAPSTRFERVTYRLGGDCSIQLSYEGVGFRGIKILGEHLVKLFLPLITPDKFRYMIL